MTPLVYHDADRPYSPPAPLESDMAVTSTGRVIRRGEVIGWLCPDDGYPFCEFCSQPTTQETTPMTAPNPDGGDTTVYTDTTEVTAELVTVEDPTDVSALVPLPVRRVIYMTAVGVAAGYPLVEAEVDVPLGWRVVLAVWTAIVPLIAVANTRRART